MVFVLFWSFPLALMTTGSHVSEQNQIMTPKHSIPHFLLLTLVKAKRAKGTTNPMVSLIIISNVYMIFKNFQTQIDPPM